MKTLFLVACVSLACQWTAELGLHWNESPGADGYRLYVSRIGGPSILLDEVPCCSVYPARLLIDAAFPIKPGDLGQLIFRVSAYNSAGESALSEPVGIVSAQRVVLP